MTHWKYFAKNITRNCSPKPFSEHNKTFSQHKLSQIFHHYRSMIIHRRVQYNQTKNVPQNISLNQSEGDFFPFCFADINSYLLRCRLCVGVMWNLTVTMEMKPAAVAFSRFAYFRFVLEALEREERRRLKTTEMKLFETATQNFCDLILYDNFMNMCAREKKE